MIRIDHYLHNDCDECATRQRLDTLIAQGEAMSAALDTIKAEVAETKDIMNSAVTLIKGLAGQIRELKDDPAALEELAKSLDEGSNALAVAVTDNTPVDPPAA